MHIRGPNWKKIWKRQKEFLHRKSSQNRDLYCGRTLKDWCLILLCLLVYYTCLVLIAFGFFMLFIIIIIDPSGPVPYRKGYVFGNEKIDHRFPEAQKFAKQLKKELDATTPMAQITMSHLDFPLLSIIPHRFDGDDEEPGASRNRKYQEQLDAYYEAFTHSNSDKSKVILKDCEGGDWFNKRFDEGRNGSTLIKTACKTPKNIMEEVEKCSKATDVKGHQNRWGIGMPPRNKSETGSHGRGIPVTGYSPCLLIKLNKIVGFLPIPWTERLVEVYNDTVNKNGSQVVGIPDHRTLADKVSTDGAPARDKLPLACTLGFRGDDPQSKRYEKSEIKKFFVKNDTAEVEEDFLEYIPGPWIDLRQYPFMGNEDHPTFPTIIKLHFNKFIKERDVITLECRVYARNIPYKYRMDITPKNHFGHVRIRMKYYYDKNKDENYWKIEK